MVIKFKQYNMAHRESKLYPPTDPVYLCPPQRQPLLSEVLCVCMCVSFERYIRGQPIYPHFILFYINGSLV